MRRADTLVMGITEYAKTRAGHLIAADVNVQNDMDEIICVNVDVYEL